jgi:hypothetical protein
MTDYESMNPIDICELIGQPYKRLQQYCITACYNSAAHRNGDRHPSLTVYGKGNGYYCYVCSESGTISWLLKQYGVRRDNYMPVKIERKDAKAEKPVMTVPDWYSDRLFALWERLPLLPAAAREAAEAKGFDAEAFEYMPNLDPMMGWRWHTDQVKGWPEGIFMPYMFEGKMVTARLRMLNGEKRSIRHSKADPHPSWPYNFDAIMQNRSVMVCEGETDTLTLSFLGLPSVGIPGASNDVAIARLIEQAASYNTRLVIVPDNDKASEGFAKRVRLAAFEAMVACDVARVPFGKDVNEFFLQATDEQLDTFLERYEPKQPTYTDELRYVRQVFGDVEVVTNDPSYQLAA